MFQSAFMRAGVLDPEKTARCCRSMFQSAFMRAGVLDLMEMKYGPENRVSIRVHAGRRLRLDLYDSSI